MCEMTDKVHWLFGTAQQCAAITRQPPLESFAEETLCFFDKLSRSLLCHPEARQLSDLMYFAFWCRRTHLEQMRREYTNPVNPRLGKGVSLHFASSNMPMLFAFSLTAGLLAGNACIVRLPRKETRQEQIVIEVMRTVIDDVCPEFAGRILLCRYDHDAEMNQMLSGLCDVRVMWGTDVSIAEISKARLKPGAAEIAFGTRYSAGILDAKAVLATEKTDLLAKDFYNDTYLNDQNACSSPRILYWVGEKEEVRQAKVRFWAALGELLTGKTYQVPAFLAVRKLDAALMLAACYPAVQISRDNRIVRVSVETLCPDLWEMTVPGGFFIESEGETPEGLFPVLDRHCQTLTCYGFDQGRLSEQLYDAKVPGVDRLVDFGHALDFSLTWDRHNLIEEMSRPV